jgi:hypothetical protein
MDSLPPFPYGSFIPYNVPVCPAALRIARHPGEVGIWPLGNAGMCRPPVTGPAAALGREDDPRALPPPSREGTVSHRALSTRRSAPASFDKFSRLSR